jgi:hypothetical protein
MCGDGEMAYATALGAVALTGVGVQVPLPAPLEMTQSGESGDIAFKV